MTDIASGLAPALHVSRSNQQHTLKDGSRGAAGSRRTSRFSFALVVAELALTIVLLVGTAAMVRSFLTLYTVDLGIDVPASLGPAHALLAKADVTHEHVASVLAGLDAEVSR